MGWTIRCDEQAVSVVVSFLQRGPKRSRKVICRKALVLWDIIINYQDSKVIIVAWSSCQQPRRVQKCNLSMEWCHQVRSAQPWSSHLVGAAGTLPASQGWGDLLVPACAPLWKYEVLNVIKSCYEKKALRTTTGLYSCFFSLLKFPCWVLTHNAHARAHAYIHTGARKEEGQETECAHMKQCQDVLKWLARSLESSN